MTTQTRKPKTTKACSCGHYDAHVVATRQNADGIPVYGYSDGSIALGSNRIIYAKPGFPMVCLWIVMDEVCLYTSEELPRLVKFARKCVR